ncbi:PaaI family thioesterase [Pendulispora brunnea]|uniref:PaaI family thioesterase n=1 Tax=Pendulispora brunnea TaxID=2905690 RepID=A0ABZ2KIU2_9BACT
MKETARIPKTQGHLRWIEKLVRGEVSPPPSAKLLGFRAVQIEVGRAVFELDVGAQHASVIGTMHGGILCDLGDAAMGLAMSSTLEDDESFTTIELSAKYFKPVWTGRLTAVGRVSKRTRKLGALEADVTDESGSLVGKLSSTCLVLRGEEAKGR